MLLPESIQSIIREALAEDIGQGDITTNSTIPEDVRCEARVVTRQPGVLSGSQVFRTVFELLNSRMSDWNAVPDGQRFSAGQEVVRFQGLTRSVLTGERVALNFLQRLSGIATLTAEFVGAVNGLGVKICDTRKTTPLMRRLQKLAVTHGGGANHRFALFDGVLIKENHIVGAGGIRDAVRKACQGTHHLLKIGVEVTTVEEAKEAADAGADAIVFDNMRPEDIRSIVAQLKDRRIIFEASGNVTFDTVRALAETGVHVISIGALTHSAPAIDMSLLIRNV
ncbi:MAG: carboxylating nicotinate-nucleotide diphosphorylase [Candidatus Hydrogenedentes bacterium]|nr:carboxylating nicotinate-nucleotide diphosphorylase [Candidatus Hydrogenedentota bacterium]